MQEIKHTGDEEFTESASLAEIINAVGDETNERVIVHKSKNSFLEAKLKYKRKQNRKAQKIARKKQRRK